MNVELKWYFFKEEVIIWEFILNNGIIVYVRKVLISLIEKVIGCFRNYFKECCIYFSSYFKFFVWSLNSVY